MAGLKDGWADGWMGGGRWRKHLWLAAYDVLGMTQEDNSWPLPVLHSSTFCLRTVRTHVTPNMFSVPPRKSLANQHSTRKRSCWGQRLICSPEKAPGSLFSYIQGECKKMNRIKWVVEQSLTQSRVPGGFGMWRCHLCRQRLPVDRFQLHIRVTWGELRIPVSKLCPTPGAPGCLKAGAKSQSLPSDSNRQPL